MTVHMMPGFACLVCGVGLSVLLAGAVSAQSDNVIPHTPVLQLSLLQDRGGANTPGPDGLPLYQRFTQMLLFAFAAEAQNSGGKNTLPFVVRAPQPKNKVQPSVRYVLEGDLSASSKDQGPYLCVLRLRDLRAEGGPRVIAQWAGTAQTLRDLSGNLSRDPRVHALGLAGDMVHQATDQLRERIADEEAAANSASFAERLRQGESDRLRIEAIPEGSTEPTTTITPGTKYKLRVTTLDEGTVAIFAVNDPARPVAAFAQDAANLPDASQGTPLLLPAKQPLMMEAGRPAPVFVAVLTKATPESLLPPRSRDSTTPPAVVVINALPRRASGDSAVDPLVPYLLMLWNKQKTAPVTSMPLTVQSASEEKHKP